MSSSSGAIAGGSFSAMDGCRTGIRRITFALPFGIDHVHCYFLRSSTGGWIARRHRPRLPRSGGERWRPVLDELDAPIERIVVTHMHPDHVGGARDIAELTGAPVLQGREDYDAVRGRVGPTATPSGSSTTGLARDAGPDDRGIRRESERLMAAVHWVAAPELLDAGDEVDGWRVEVLRGHADGHIVLLRDGVMIAGDTILGGITPAIGLYPNSRPDPLGDYLADARPDRGARAAGRLHRAPRCRCSTLRGAPARSASHHRERLTYAQAALNGEPVSGYDVSLALCARRSAPDAAPFRDGRVARAPGAARARGPRRPRGAPVRQRRYHVRREAASDRRSRRAGELSRARADAAPARRRRGRDAQAGAARRPRRSRDPGRRVDDLHAADAALRSRRGAHGVRPRRSSARAPG